MKKITAMILTAVMAFTLAACGADKDQETPGGNGTVAEGSEISSAADESGTGTESSGGVADAAAVTDAVSLLAAIWDGYGDSEKFAVAGGDFSEENSVMDAPGRYGIEDTAMLDSALGLPESSAGLIDDAASLMHMMNANTFTCGAFHVGNEGDVSAVADSLKANILDREWMCGFPDKLIIFRVDDYVISAFGNEEIIETFKTKLQAVYPSAVLLYEESVL